MLEHNWAYGSKGTALHGKRMLSLITTGGGATAYRRDGYNRYTIRELLAPIEQTAFLCGMTYLPPYLIQGTHRLDDEQIAREVERYSQLLTLLHNDQIDLAAVQQLPYFNEALEGMYRDEVTR